MSNIEMILASRQSPPSPHALQLAMERAEVTRFHGDLRVLFAAAANDRVVVAKEVKRLELAATEREEELQRRQRQMAELRKRNSWACLYCGEVTRDRSAAAIHAVLCEKWPYRLEVERLRETLRKVQWVTESGRPGTSAHPTCVGCGAKRYGALSGQDHAEDCPIEAALK